MKYWRATRSRRWTGDVVIRWLVDRDDVFGRQCVQERQTCSIGGRPIGVKVGSPLAWVASVEETKLVKPTDKAIVKDGERVTGLQRKWCVLKSVSTSR